ncbi:MAG TPA: hypothetical protein IAD47_07025 [Candidatus Limihabitans stercoravium]|nr:hypothetical protein [Candidatus Limihabitans stercoravium]
MRKVLQNPKYGEVVVEMDNTNQWHVFVNGKELERRGNNFFEIQPGNTVTISQSINGKAYFSVDGQSCEIS